MIAHTFQEAFSAQWIKANRVPPASVRDTGVSMGL